jgi:uncharacterized protein (DUF885 family)
MKSLFLVLLSLLCLTGTALVPANAAPNKQADEKFKTLYAKEWKWRQAQQGNDEDDPVHHIRAKLPDERPQTQAMRLNYWRDVMTALSAINPKALSAENQVNYAVYRAQIMSLIDQQKFREFEKPLNADTFFWGGPVYAARKPFAREEDARNFISQMNDIPRYFAEETENMRAGLARGFTPPKVTLIGRDSSIASVAEAKSAQETIYYSPFKSLPASLSEDVKTELQAKAVKAITESVIPAHKALLKFMRDDYMPNARESLGAFELPDGRAYYQSKILEFATVDLTPDQIHQIGLDEVAAIKAQMRDVMKEVGFVGDFAAFLTFLKTDKQFYTTTPDQLLKEAAFIAKKFDGKASQYFGHLPRSRFAIVPVPADIAPFYTAGRGGPGVYLLNTYDLPSRPLYSLPALTLHESAPGHAFQIPLAAENKSQPEFRRNVYTSAYGEGWALYCEKLGVEMGMYETPYDRFGMLSYQMWRAARLLIDTGIHAKGWTREQAQTYLQGNTALSDHEVETEVDRYIAWPGQALSYYLGERAILMNRARAEKALGAKFNIRAFHDAILALGSVPIPVIDQRVDQFIAEGGKGPYPDEE